MTSSETQRSGPPPPLTGISLYGRSGQPHGLDITQGALGDCYLISTLGQFADRQPAVIRNAIHHDAKEQTVAVRLHDAGGQSRTVTVMQDDLHQHRSYGPGRTGGVDSPSYWATTHTNGLLLPPGQP